METIRIADFRLPIVDWAESAIGIQPLAIPPLVSASANPRQLVAREHVNDARGS
jgi:hypothetical protein